LIWKIALEAPCHGLIYAVRAYVSCIVAMRREGGRSGAVFMRRQAYQRDAPRKIAALR
jgi:hypothetical protein